MWHYVMQVAFMSLKTLVLKYDYFFKVRKVPTKLKLSESFIICKEKEVALANSSYLSCPKFFGWCVHVSEGSGKLQLFQVFRTAEMQQGDFIKWGLEELEAEEEDEEIQRSARAGVYHPCAAEIKGEDGVTRDRTLRWPRSRWSLTQWELTGQEL